MPSKEIVMSMESLLYISRSQIANSEAASEVDAIVATAVAFNPAHELTGALLFTGTHFAQVLEGEGASLDRLMASISQDPRHDQLMVVSRGPLAHRNFPEWSMAYFGPSQFVARHVTRLLNNPAPAEVRRATEWLTDLLREFSAGPNNSIRQEFPHFFTQ
jgi:hypothetical protein